METQIFHHSKNIPNLQNNPLKETQNPSRYYISIKLISSFKHKPEYHVSKILIYIYIKPIIIIIT
jgi:hypothetical protein